MQTDLFYVNVEAAIYDGDRWLMIIRSENEGHARGTLSMVGGTVTNADTAQDTLESALRREIAEEIGVTLDGTIHYLESKHFFSDENEQVLDVVFVTRFGGGTPKILNSDEVHSIHWMQFVEIESHEKTPPWILESMRKAEHLRLKLHTDIKA